MKNIKFILVTAIIATNSIQLWSCTNAIQVKVNRTPELKFNDQQQFAIKEVNSQLENCPTKQALDLKNEMTNQLAADKNIQLIDLSLQKHGAVQSSTDNQNEYEQDKNNVVLISAQIIKNEYKEELNKRQSITLPKGNVVNTFDKKGTYHLLVNYNLVDSRTGKVLSSKTIDASTSATTTGHYHSLLKIDEYELFQLAIHEAAKRLKNLITPYNETVAITLEKDNKLKDLNVAITLLKEGQLDQSISLMKEMTTINSLTSNAK
jgi:hypothetical protein